MQYEAVVHDTALRVSPAATREPVLVQARPVNVGKAAAVVGATLVIVGAG